MLYNYMIYKKNLIECIDQKRLFTHIEAGLTDHSLYKNEV